MNAMKGKQVNAQQQNKENNNEKQNWFSKIPQQFESLQQAGQLLGVTMDDSFSQSPNFQDQEQPTTKDLLKIFSKKDFRIDELLKNFYNQYEKSGIHDYLVNRLYSYNEADLNFYMAELCYLYITRHSESLKKFLIDMCARSINLYLLIYWSLDAFSDSLKTDETKKEQFERIQYILNIAEAAFKEGNKNNQLQYNYTDMKQQAKEKEMRAKYNDSIKIFIKNMVNISLTLKKHDINDRKDKLKMYMKRSDKWLHQLREKNPYKQVIFCFCTNIVRVVHDEVTCFNTKMRVPYRVAIETIDVNELNKAKLKSQTINEIDDKENIGDGPEFTEGVGEGEGDVEGDVQPEKVMQTQESHDKINKYGRNFSIWAYEQETEEQKLKEIRLEQQKIENKGLLIHLLNNDEEQTSVEKFHRLYKKSKSLVADDLNVGHLRRFQRKIKLQQTYFEDPERFKQYEENLKRFKIYFKEKKVNKHMRRNSVSTEYNLIDPFRENHQYINRSLKQICKKRRKVSLKDLKVLDVLKFFKSLQRNYPQYEKEIQMIYKYLHYDELEEQIAHSRLSCIDLNEEDEDISQKNISSFIIKRKFPWEDVWEDKQLKIKRDSPYGNFKSFKARAVIFKGGDDLRQELLAMQLIYKFQSIFQTAQLQLWLRPYEIIVTSASSGILEFLPNTYSIDGLKKKVPKFTNLHDFYKEYYGKQFQQAQSNFIESLAGYSIVSYLLQFKDRHNGNILIDNTGRLIHIDFGFMFCISPGGINFENAPFKLTKEYVQLMGGKESEGFERYKQLMFQGFKEIQKYVEEIIFLVQIMQEESDLPCFRGFDIRVFRDRFQENLDEKNLLLYVNRLVYDSYDNWRTKQYDNFQKMTNGILP